MIFFEIKIFLLLTFTTKITKCTISGISYMDPLNFRSLPEKDKNDPCNSLYWYPKAIPEYCNRRTTLKPYMAKPPEGMVPLPIPVPLPDRFPDFPFPLPIPPIPAPPCPVPQPVSPIISHFPPQLPFGLPLIPSNPMLPVRAIPYPATYPYPRSPQVGMVPGIRGLVSDDGGINILPFSDAYSDLLEKHNNKMLRKRMQKLLADYDRYPRKRRRKHRKRFSHY